MTSWNRRKYRMERGKENEFRKESGECGESEGSELSENNGESGESEASE